MNQLTMEEIKLLNEKAKNIRIDILKAITKANSGHTGGSLSIADLLTLLFFHEMNINPANPKMENRDRLVISKGHGAPALYAAGTPRYETYPWCGYDNRITGTGI